MGCPKARSPARLARRASRGASRHLRAAHRTRLLHARSRRRNRRARQYRTQPPSTCQRSLTPSHRTGPGIRRADWGRAMNHPVDVHPEDLLDREQLGALSDDEQRRLDAHAIQCAACALVRDAAADFARERAPMAGDDSMAERIVAAAMGRPLASSPPPPASGYLSSHPRRKRRAWAVAGVVMFAATGATASFWSVRHVLIQRLLFNPPPSPPVAAEIDGRVATPRVLAQKPAEDPSPPLQVEAPVATSVLE